MVSDSGITLNERVELAKNLMELSNEPLSLTDKPRNYIAIEVGFKPNKNAIGISKHRDRVSFLVRSTDLLRRLEMAGFTPVPVPQTRPMMKDKYFIFGVSKEDINRHQALFREAVKESIETVRSRKSKKNR